jgi:hypothetical protein
MAPQAAMSYLQTTNSLLLAGRRLQNYMESDRSKVGFAVSQLEQLAQQHTIESAHYQAFMYQDLQGAPGTTADKHEQLTGDFLVKVLADLQTANVLMAAGQGLGEVGPQKNPKLLNEALTQLESSKGSVARVLLAPESQGAKIQQFGFEEAGAQAAPTAVDVSAQSFAERAQNTLSGLVGDAQGVVSSVFEELKKVDSGKVMEALGSLGEKLTSVGGMGRLFAQGFEKLKTAVNSLIDWLGSTALTQIRSRVQEFWKQLQEGKLLAHLLEVAFSVEATSGRIHEVCGLKNADLEALKRGMKDLADVQTKFRAKMTVGRHAALAIGLAATIAAFTPLAPQAALAAVSAYSLILAAVILLGMEYADSHSLLTGIRGVGTIVATILPS